MIDGGRGERRDVKQSVREVRKSLCKAVLLTFLECPQKVSKGRSFRGFFLFWIESLHIYFPSQWSRRCVCVCLCGCGCGCVTIIALHRCLEAPVCVCH